MITTLDQLTIARFVDLLCGDTSAIIGKHEIGSPEKVAIAMRNIVFEYKEIADPGGMQAYIVNAEEYAKAKIEIALFRICENLIRLKLYPRVIEILDEYGVNASSMKEARLEAEVKSRLEKAKRNKFRAASEINGPDESQKPDVRRLFDEQTASLMAHFKFQIDMESMKATLYAYLVARYNREIKAQMDALKKINS